MLSNRCGAGRAVALHRFVYEVHLDVGAVILAQPANLMAFSVSHTESGTRLMPESFVFLREVEPVPFGVGTGTREPWAEASHRGDRLPWSRTSAFALPGELLQAFDRLEVAEFSATSVLQAQAIGGVINRTAAGRRETTDAYIRD